MQRDNVNKVDPRIIVAPTIVAPTNAITKPYIIKHLQQKHISPTIENPVSPRTNTTQCPKEPP
jgi:hypothetical protein